MGDKSSKLKHSQSPPAASESSIYSPLPSARHIRLVDLSCDESRIVAKHSTVSLDEAPPFCALSYTWGVPTQRDLELRMQAPEIPITENLTSAMFFLGSIIPGKYWIDALCINQKDAAEKSSQVALMRDIYGAARAVIVFLGPKDDDSTMACNLIGKLCELFQNGTFDLEDAAIKWSPTVASKYPFKDSKLRELGLPLAEAGDWIALASFLSRPYFERIWVLQELVMAGGNILAFCGSFQLPWAALQMTQRVLLATGWDSALRALASEHGRQLEMQALSFLPLATTLMHSPGNKFGLQGLLDMSRFLLATDPRDNIIALLGMTTEADDAEMSMILRPDYGKSVQQIYTEITGTFITRGSLDLLSSVETKVMRCIEGLPSWVPDYSGTSHNGIFAKGYAAGGDTSVSATWTPGSTELRVEAFVADTVKVISPHGGGSCYGDSSSPEEFLVEIFIMTARYFGSGASDEYDWLGILAQKRSDINLDALWQTLIGAGNTLGHSPASPDMRNHFATLIARTFAKILFNESEEVQRKLVAIPNSLDLLSMGDPRLFVAELLDRISGNRFFITENDTMGLATRDLQPGDKVMIFSGASPIYIVREREGYHQFIGDGYVWGLMSGEAVSGKHNDFAGIILK